MSSSQILLLYFGLPLSILGVGLRRAVGFRRLGLVLLASTGVGLYALGLEAALLGAGRSLIRFGAPNGKPASEFGLFCLAGAILGALGAILIRFQGAGSSRHEQAPTEGGDGSHGA